MARVGRGLFQSTLPARGERHSTAQTKTMRMPDGYVISIHAPRPHGERWRFDFNPRSRTGSDGLCAAVKPISIHAPPRGGATAKTGSSPTDAHFNPRSPHGERRRWFSSTIAIHKGSDFNPRSPHGERRLFAAAHVYRLISIHAPRTGSGREILVTGVPPSFQSTLPARGRRDQFAPSPSNAHFNPRSPARGATLPALQSTLPGGLNFNPRSPRGRERPLLPAGHDRRMPLFHFNPRSPHGERRRTSTGGRPHQNFNPRSPHGERRRIPAAGRSTAPFQSTLPARERRTIVSPHRAISIHAPRTGSDDVPFMGGQLPHYISIHAPRTGTGRDWAHAAQGSARPPFQSTLPARGATWGRSWTTSASAFQSTLPARGATAAVCRAADRTDHFNPRSPRTGSDR